MRECTQIKLSIIVPTYGVEKYINRFFNSLRNNLLRGVEVLIIDDGSKDRSGVISDEFALKYPEYIKVVHKENGGVSSARNTGLDLAKGEYIIFADPDDYLAEGYTENILNAIENYNKPDIIFFDYYYGTEVGGFKRNTVSKFKGGFINKELFIRESIKDVYVKGMVWNKLIKKKLFEGLTFNIKTRISEDHELLTDLILRLDTIVYEPKPLYYYITREDSLTQSITLNDAIKLYRIAEDRYQKHSKTYKCLSVSMLVKAAYNVLAKSYQYNSNIDTKIYENAIRNNIFKIIFGSDYTINEKKRFLMVYFGLVKIYHKYKNKK